MLATIKSKLSQLFQSPTFQKYAQNAGWLMSERMITMAVAFVISALVARYLGAEGMGILGYALSLTSFLDIFIKLGMVATLTRNLVREPEKTETILGSAIGLRAIGTFLGVCVMIIGILIVPQEKVTVHVLLILSLSTILNGGQVLYNYFESRVITKYDARMKIITLVIVSIFKLSLVYIFQADVVWFAVSFVLTEAINFAGQIWIYHRRGYGHVRNWKVEKATMLQLFKESWPLIFSSALQIIYTKTDQIMIKHFLNDEQVGIFYVSDKFSFMFFFIPSIIVSTLAPRIYEAREQNKELFEKRVQELMNIQVVVMLTIIFGVSLLGPTVVELVYGPEFIDSGKILPFHVWGGLFMAIGGAASTFLLAINMERIVFMKTLFGAVANIALNIILIPKYGVMGAAIATLITQAIASYFTYLFFPRTRDLFWMQTKALLLIGPTQQLFKLINNR